MINDAPRKVWLVEDSALDAALTRRCLEPAHQVEVFSEAAPMLERLAAGSPPQLVMMDVELPGLSGIDACRFVREKFTRLDLPVLMLTKHTEKGSVVAGLAAGANDYVTKPFDAAELQARSTTLINSSLLFQRACAAEKAHREALTLLDREGQRIRELITQTSAAVCAVRGPDHLCEFANQAFRQLCGVEDLVGHSMRTRLPELRGAPWIEALDRVIATGETHIAQAVPVHLRPEGSGNNEDLYYRFVYQPKRHADGTVVGVDLLAFDVTDEVGGKRKLEELMSLASHELKTPITALRLHLQNLTRWMGTSLVNIDRDRVRRTLDLLDRQMKRQMRLIDDLVNVSRLATGQLQLEFEEVDVSALAREVGERFAEEGLEGPVSVAYEIEEGVTANVDRFRLDQVLTNLISNAVKYGRNRPVHVIVESVGTRRIRVSVRDEGIGINAHDIDRVFDRFERAVSRNHYAGLGLGLWISRRITEAMGGTISVTSEMDVGSTFTVELPRSQRNDVLDPTRREGATA